VIRSKSDEEKRMIWERIFEQRSCEIVWLILRTKAFQAGQNIESVGQYLKSLWMKFSKEI